MTFEGGTRVRGNPWPYESSACLLGFYCPYRRMPRRPLRICLASPILPPPSEGRQRVGFPCLMMSVVIW